MAGAESSMLVFALLSLFACGNACQEICGQMKAYADECGFEASAEDVEVCRETLEERPDDVTLETCREASSPAAIREWWTCEDLAENFLGGAG